MADEETRTSVRLPDKLLDRLRLAADRNRRSVHAQMLVYIERGLDEDEEDHDHGKDHDDSKTKQR